jgi:hypothetical protein
MAELIGAALFSVCVCEILIRNISLRPVLQHKTTLSSVSKKCCECVTDGGKSLMKHLFWHTTQRKVLFANYNSRFLETGNYIPAKASGYLVCESAEVSGY